MEQNIFGENSISIISMLFSFLWFFFVKFLIENSSNMSWMFKSFCFTKIERILKAKRWFFRTRSFKELSSDGKASSRKNVIKTLKWLKRRLHFQRTPCLRELISSRWDFLALKIQISLFYCGFNLMECLRPRNIFIIGKH